MRSYMGASKLLMLIVERHETNASFIEEELNGAGGAATVLGNDEVGDVLAFSIGIIVIFAVEEHYNISILLDRTGFAEVG